MNYKTLVLSILVLLSLQGYSQMKSDNTLSEKQLIRQLIELANKQGGIKSEIEKEDSLQTINTWLKSNGESIYRAKASDLKKPDWGYYTKSRKELYAHVFDWPKSGTLKLHKDIKVKKATILTNPNTELETLATSREVLVEVPMLAPDATVTVVKIELK